MPIYQGQPYSTPLQDQYTQTTGQTSQYADPSTVQRWEPDAAEDANTPEQWEDN